MAGHCYCQQTWSERMNGKEHNREPAQSWKSLHWQVNSVSHMTAFFKITVPFKEHLLKAPAYPSISKSLAIMSVYMAWLNEIRLPWWFSGVRIDCFQRWGASRCSQEEHTPVSANTSSLGRTSHSRSEDLLSNTFRSCAAWRNTCTGALAEREEERGRLMVRKKHRQEKTNSLSFAFYKKEE